MVLYYHVCELKIVKMSILFESLYLFSASHAKVIMGFCLFLVEIAS